MVHIRKWNKYVIWCKYVNWYKYVKWYKYVPIIDTVKYFEAKAASKISTMQLNKSSQNKKCSLAVLPFCGNFILRFV